MLFVNVVLLSHSEGPYTYQLCLKWTGGRWCWMVNACCVSIVILTDEIKEFFHLAETMES